MLSQEQYCKKVLENFGMLDADTAPTPLVNLLPKEADNDEDFDHTTYQSAIGSLMYLMMATRPDIAFAVSHLSQFCAKPKRSHFKAVKRVFRYLKGTIDQGVLLKLRPLPFNHSKKFNDLSIISGYTDADWGRDSNDQKSTGAYAFFVAGMLVSWTSKKQQFVATSTMQSEYAAASHATKEAIWLRNLVAEINFFAETHIPDLYQEDKATLCPITIFSDNQAAIRVAKASEYHKKAKHIDITVHFLRQRVRMGYIHMEFVRTREMPADFLTKPLLPEAFRRCKEAMGLENVEEEMVKEKGQEEKRDGVIQSGDKEE